MAGEWFCRIAGRVRGPLSPAQLKTLAARGELDPQDLVRHGSTGAWVPADRVKGLFSAAPPKTPPPIPLGFRAPAESDAGVVIDHDLPTRPTIQLATAAGTISKQKHQSRRMRRLQFVGMALLLLIVVVLAVIGYVLWRQGAPSEKPPPTVPVAPRPAVSAKKPEPKPKPVVAASQPPQPEIKWYNAATETVVFPDEQVAIKIREVRVATLGARFAVRDPTQKYLIVAVNVQNNSTTKKLDFEAWGRLSPSSVGVTLGDEHGNRYKLIRIQGEQSPSIYPGKAYLDEVIFEPPIDSAKTLRLALPASAFGGKGVVHFEISRTLITLVPDPAERPSEKPAEKPVDPPAATTTPDSRPPVRHASLASLGNAAHST